jgi:hypothetical protein
MVNQRLLYKKYSILETGNKWKIIVKIRDKMKNKTYHTVWTILDSNIIILKRGKMDTYKTQIHDGSLSCLCAGTSMDSGGIQLVLWVQIILKTFEAIVSCKTFEAPWKGNDLCSVNKGNNKITELRTILQRESQNS